MDVITWKCYCGELFSSKYNLNRHIKNSCKKVVQSSTRENNEFFDCPICNKKFNRQDNWAKHIQTRHESMAKEYLVNSDTNPSFVTKQQCNICEKWFSAKTNLNKHMRKLHQIDIKFPVIGCPLCDENFVTPLVLYDHIRDKHNISITEETMTFDSMNEFKEWKKNIEKEDTAYFRVQKNSSNKIYYVCHRSGKKPDLRAHTKKSCKTGKRCPARIIAINDNGRIIVLFQRKHLGHSQTIEYLRLTKEDRAELAEKLSNGMTFKNILNDVRLKSKNKQSISRSDIVKKRDLYNIIRDFKLDKDLVNKKDITSERHNSITAKESLNQVEYHVSTNINKNLRIETSTSDEYNLTLESLDQLNDSMSNADAESLDQLEDSVSNFNDYLEITSLTSEEFNSTEESLDQFGDSMSDFNENVEIETFTSEQYNLINALEHQKEVRDNISNLARFETLMKIASRLSKTATDNVLVKVNELIEKAVQHLKQNQNEPSELHNYQQSIGPQSNFFNSLKIKQASSNSNVKFTKPTQMEDGSVKETDINDANEIEIEYVYTMEV